LGEGTAIAYQRRTIEGKIARSAGVARRGDLWSDYKAGQRRQTAQDTLKSFTPSAAVASHAILKAKEKSRQKRKG
ncbi:MAG TPA: hypothetical protein VMF08_13025, partial [Candidatus Sulfotelmatobacter sp.]|nr:hypothetical protein [Candidatus Sulfotelmatobacter sp.]